ncbi:MAG: STAS domain-containing protein [Dolichospermum sp.]|jgi:anti-anti-sigma factor|uniref:STAS domain-containing protein n=1 Tax=Dolichospermum circinale TaxID=109265 RepID=UPI0004238889|nr:STAS domain-containing protein [Dolichospermum circinale]MCE2719423.1 STAS domain-containing protein [Anabaena sp. 49628_E55]MDB9481792.1 STAS domain-containing protein [Dolichospermum circinale CS-537/05]MDB9452711.1 STAS domain-containing protein [Dolichospermum circinale CS-541/06]MDB9463399.1 STAS domain-containing protein [Dolichospermum circinale CS-541/04]MDB9473574.1 STAS domain-containing protein [Dolichospermum circinale CS-537/11]
MNQQVKVIVISGNFNASTSSEFHKNIQEVIASDIKIVLIDCHSVTFMDSFGLGTLVVTFKMLEAAGIKMVICSSNEQVKMLFELTGMDNKFTIVPSQEAFENLLVSAS